MLDVDSMVVFHRITIDSTMKHVAHIKRKVDKEKRAMIDEEVQNLKKAGFITKVKYPT